MANRLNDARTKWQSPPPEAIAWLDLGVDHVAFHRASGKTHFLNASSKRLITQLLRDPMGLADIVEAFGVADSDSESMAQMEKMHSMLDRFEQLGLVERL